MTSSGHHDVDDAAKELAQYQDILLSNKTIYLPNFCYNSLILINVLIKRYTYPTCGFLLIYLDVNLYYRTIIWSSDSTLLHVCNHNDRLFICA